MPSHVTIQQRMLDSVSTASGQSRLPGVGLSPALQTRRATGVASERTVRNLPVRETAASPSHRLHVDQCLHMLSSNSASDECDNPHRDRQCRHKP